MKQGNQKARWGKEFLVLVSCLLITSMVDAAPMVLDDAALDFITAGSTEVNSSGGAVVGNSSEAIINQTSSVALSGEVQADAKGLNLVNSSASAVANAVNVWDGEGGSPAMQVEQTNMIEQAQQRSASISDYSRKEADRRVQLEHSLTEDHALLRNYHTSATNVDVSNHTLNENSSSEVDTRIVVSVGDPDSDFGQFNLEANLGQGIAVAGHLEATYDGGEAEFAMAAGGGISAEAGISGDFGGIGVGVSADASLSLVAEVVLPEMTVEINGAGCGVVLGSCMASGTLSETNEEINDKSTLAILNESSTGSSHFSEKRVEEYRSPFEIGHAQAEYIVVDNSSLVVNNTFTLMLSGNSQRNVKAMNIVNAIGSAVTNAVNVARNNQVTGNSQMTLTQSNIVTHGR